MSWIYPIISVLKDFYLCNSIIVFYRYNAPENAYKHHDYAYKHLDYAYKHQVILRISIPSVY